MSLSPTTKETVLPPQSPLSLQSHLSPRLLTPDSDHLTHHHPSTAGFDSLSFAKQPILPRKPTSRTPSATRGGWGMTESEASDGHVSEVPIPQSPGVQGGGGAGGKSGHLSLLTAILSSPDTAPRPAPRKTIIQPTTATSGIISGSSNPSTTLSSPATREPHGILQNTKAEKAKVVDENIPPSSILRRESASASSDAGAVFSDAGGLGSGMSGVTSAGEMNPLDGLVGKLQKIEEKRERIGWADAVQRVTPQSANLARVPSTGSSIGPRPRLQFAVAHPPSHGSTSASEAGDIASRRTSSAAPTSRRPSSPFAKERKVQESLDEMNSDDDDEDEDEEEEEEEEEELDNGTPGSSARMPGTSRSTSSSGRRSLELQSPIDEEDDDDLGYQEDEEDGMFSDEEETAAFDIPGDVVKRKFAFARPTNYFRGRRPGRNDISSDPISPGTTPPMISAPTLFPPPNRRGRGHVRVAAPELPVEKEKKGCTRHCSPPPNTRLAVNKVEVAPPAVASPSARFLKRSEPVQAGPSKQRIVGSPMPPRVLVNDDDEDDDEDEEEEEDEEDEDDRDDEEGPDGIADAGGARGEEKSVEQKEVLDRSSPVVRGGWRSDDAVFQPTTSRIPSRAIRPFDPSVRLAPSLVHAPAVFEEESDDDQSVAASMAPPATDDDTGLVSGGGVRQWIRRASEQLPMFRRPSTATTPESRPSSRDASASYTAPLPCQATCPPALDYTPVAGTSVLTDEGEGAVNRLGKTLSVNHGPSRDPAGTSPAESSSVTPPAILPQPKQSDTQSGLGRAVSSGSNKVKFQSPERPLRPNHSPSRAVSGATHYLAETKSRKEAEKREKAVGRSVSGTSKSVSGTENGVVPIKCPKRLCRNEELGWSDEALMSIRKQVGKGARTE